MFVKENPDRKKVDCSEGAYYISTVPNFKLFDGTIIHYSNNNYKKSASTHEEDANYS